MRLDPSSPHRPLVVVCLLLVISLVMIAFSGCREELHSEVFATATVQGVVQVSGQPVPGGYVEIQPAPGTMGNLRVGPIAPDGTFHLDRVAVGPVVVSLSRLPIGLIPSVRGPVDPRVFSLQWKPTERVPLERSIPPQSPYRLPPIDLLHEVARHQRKTAGRRKKRSGKGGLKSVPQLPKTLGLELDPYSRPSGRDKIRVDQALTTRIIYRDTQGSIHLDWPLDQLQAAIADAQGTVWVDFEDLDSEHNGEVEAMLRDIFHFHPLAIEDALKDVNVPRIDDWGQYLYLVINTIDFHPETDALQLHELDLFVGANFLVTYHHEPIEVLDRQHRLIEREPEERLRLGASHLLHHLLDEVVAEFLPAIEHLDDAINAAQDEVFDHATPATLRRIFHIKSCALRLNRVVIPMREVLNRLARDPYSQIVPEHRVYFRDVYDHLVRVHDIVESLRDLIGGALDTYLSIVSNRTNDIMKVLTLLNVMFLPMTFLAGFFGMNFFGETLMFTSPILPKTTLFWLTVTIMILTPVGMWLLARRRGWFE